MLLTEQFHNLQPRCHKTHEREYYCDVSLTSAVAHDIAYRRAI